MPSVDSVVHSRVGEIAPEALVAVVIDDAPRRAVAGGIKDQHVLVLVHQLSDACEDGGQVGW